MSANVIPSGRELTRTPPMSQVKKKLSFSSEAVPRSGLTAIHGGTGRHRDVLTDTDIDTKVGDRLSNDQNAPFDFNTPERAHGVLEPQGSEFRRSRIGSTTTVSSKDPIAMLRGMEGYQLTQTDQDFIERMNQEKVLKRLEVELADLERSINREAMDLELSLASEEKALHELKKLPSCEEMVDLAKPFLSQTMPISELDVLEQRTLLAMVEEPKVLLVISQKKKALAAMEDRVRKKEAEEKEKQEKCILERKHEIKGLMIQLANLQSDLAKETETCTALEVMATSHPAVQIKMKEATVSLARQEAVISQIPLQLSKKRVAAAPETLAILKKPINVASKQTNGHPDDQSVMNNSRGKAETVKMASTASSELTKPKTNRSKVKIEAAQQTSEGHVTSSRRSSKTSNVSTEQMSQKGGKSIDSKPKSRKISDSEPTAAQPAAAKKTRKATSVKETTTAPEQADSLRRSKRIASSKNSKK